MDSLKVEALCRTQGHVPISCSSSQLVLRSWMLPSLASLVRRRWRPNAGDRSISLVGFRARRCSFSGTVAEPCAWESRCCLGSLRRTVGSEFHLLNKSVGARPLNEHVMHFVGSTASQPSRSRELMLLRMPLDDLWTGQFNFLASRRSTSIAQCAHSQ